MTKIYKTILPAITVVMAAGIVTSCDDDEPGDNKKTEVSGSTANTNPMRGKTIRHAGIDEDDNHKYIYDFSVSFSDRTWERVIKWEWYFKDWFDGQLKLDSSNNVKTQGTYVYSENEIILTYDNGGSWKLTRYGNGWKDDSYNPIIYK